MLKNILLILSVCTITQLEGARCRHAAAYICNRVWRNVQAILDHYPITTLYCLQTKTLSISESYGTTIKINDVLQQVNNMFLIPYYTNLTQNTSKQLGLYSVGVGDLRRLCDGYQLPLGLNMYASLKRRADGTALLVVS